jgi:RHS repeat-associated protein
MPRHLQILGSCLFFLALFLIAPDHILAQDVWVSAGQPVGLTAYSGYGPSVDTPCGPDYSYICYGATAPPNGNIHWTVDGAPASSSYDTVDSSGTYCSADNVNIYTYCYTYWDESGFYSVLPSGDHVVTASIPASQDSSAQFSSTWYVHVAKPVPSLSVNCSPNPISFGNQNTNCTASQSAGTGSLNWTINGGYWTTTGINGGAGGFAGYGVGDYTIGVSYSGDNDYGGASASTVLTINKSTPSVIVSCSPNPISYGPQTSTCTAQTSGGSGTISTYWDGNIWCSGAAPGPVSCTGWNNQPVGNHTFSASYSGDSNYNPASASTTLVINRGTAPIDLSCSPNVLRAGQQTTCTASIPGATGTVAFYSPTTLTGQWWNGNSNSWYPSAGGNSSDFPVSITNDGALNYNISNSGSPSTWSGAAIGGPGGLNHDYFYARWTGTFVSSIGGTYTIGLNSDDGASLYVNGTQLVSNLATGQGAVGNLTYTQAGTIDLTAGATNTIVVEYQQGAGDSGIQLLWTPPGASSPSLLGWSVVPLDSAGHASISGPVLAAGNSAVTATYSGDGTYSPATATSSITVTAHPILDLSTDVNPSNVGQGVTFTALVHTGGAKPGSNVSFRDGLTEIGSLPPTPLSATNLLANSQAFANPSWGGYCGSTSNMTVNTGDISAPDGSYTATKFVAPSSFACGQTPSWGLLTGIPGGLQEGKTYTASVWLRGANGGENVTVGLNDCSPTVVSLTTSWTRYVATYSSIPAGVANCGTGPRGFQVIDNSSPNATFYLWGAQAELSDHAGPYIQTDASPRSGYGGIASLNVSSLAQGSHLISATYIGDTAITAATSLPVGQTVGTPTGGPPSIAFITPTSGYPGSSVTINGLNFGASPGSSGVTLNGLNVVVSSWSDTSITVQVPANATSGNVIVTVNGTPSNGTPFTVSSGPPAQNVAIYSFEIKDGSGNSGYAQNGNIGAYSDSVNGIWSSIGYDALNRLTNATQSVNGFTQYLCWSYDSFGNRLAQNISSSPCNGPAPTVSYNPNNQIQGLAYDAAGNLTNDGRNQYLYDAEGRVCAVQYQVQPGWPLTMTGYIYDAEGRRVAKGSISQWNCDMDNNGFTETAGYVLGPNGEQMTETDAQGNWVHTNVFANGELIATYTPNGLSFHLNDWLGTRRMDTDPFGNPGATYPNMPFGELLNPAQTIPVSEHLFTGKERDTESGLDYFGARYYESNMGRWMSPDWSSDQTAIPYASLRRPQSLNLYSYAGNNPLSRADADGHFWQELWNALRTSCGCWTKDLDAARGVADLKWRSNYMADEFRYAPPPGTRYRVSIGIVYPFGPLFGEGAAEGANTSEGPDSAQAEDTPPGTPVGRRGNPIDVTPGTNRPQKINDREFTGHALDQMQGRGIPSSVVEDTIANGIPGPGNQPGTATHTNIGNGIQVVTNTSGDVITVKTVSMKGGLL